jgi:uncharacterized membrane protein
MAMNPDLSGSLEDQVDKLRSRLLRLEKALQARGIVIDEPAPGPPVQSQISPTPAAVPPAPATQAQVAPPQPPYSGPVQEYVAPLAFAVPGKASTEGTRSLENRIGSQWFNRVGILAMLIGVTWFLKLAFDNHWIGPLGRVFIGLIAGAALIAWSENFERRGFTAFAYSLKAVGSGALYLSLWAAFSVYALMPAWAAFGAMILVTAFNGYISWARHAELLALYAIAGGLTTPLLVSTGENHEVTLFSYLLILDIAVLVLTTLLPWSRLLFAAYTGTVLFIAGWWFSFYSRQQEGRTAFFVTCFFLIFAFAPRLARMKLDEHGTSSAWDKLALVVLPVLNAALGFLAFYSLLPSTTQDWAGPWLAVAFAAFYLLLLRLPSLGALPASPPVLSGLHLAAAIVFLTIAIPLKTHGRWMTIGWLVEGAVLLWVSRRIGQLLLRRFALLCLALGLGALLIVNPDASSTLVFNERFGTFCVGIAIFCFVAWIARNSALDDETVEPIIRWPSLAAASILVVNILILVAVSSEIHNYWSPLGWRGDWSLRHENRIYAHFTYSAFFMAFGALLLSVGFWKRSAFLRWQALVLLALTIAKVFLSDISELSQGFRILSFLGLGSLLLGVSFAYQRDWLDLRGRGDQAR